MSQLEEQLEARAREVCALVESGKGREDVARYLQGLGLSVADRVRIMMRGSQLLRARGAEAFRPSGQLPASQAAFHDQVLDHLESDEFIASLEAGPDDDDE